MLKDFKVHKDHQELTELMEHKVQQDLQVQQELTELMVQ